MNLIDAIKKRTSVRSYLPKTLSPLHQQHLQKHLDNASSPFGGSFTMTQRSFDFGEEAIPSTYGVIKGARSFMLMAYSDDNNDALSAGYAMERVVLEATAEGLATCWLAGTFKGSQFSRGFDAPEGQKLHIVIPVGYHAEKRSLRERIMRFAVSSDKRKPMESLFFEGSFENPIKENNPFYGPLSMLRLAPSSSNTQPWRAVAVGDTIHFYVKSRGQLSWLDCGIGLCHFDIGLGSRKGHYHKDDKAPAPSKGLEYVISFRLE